MEVVGRVYRHRIPSFPWRRMVANKRPFVNHKVSFGGRLIGVEERVLYLPQNSFSEDE